MITHFIKWVLCGILIFGAWAGPLKAEGHEIAVPNDEIEQAALSHLRDNRWKLIDHKVNLRLDFSRARILDIVDDRHPLEDRPLEKDFRVDQPAFWDFFGKKYSIPNGAPVALLKIECRYSHDVEFGQITPVFHIKWTCKASSGDEFVIKSFGFGKRFNDLAGPSDKRRKLMIESASIAYQEALFRAILELTK